MIKKGIDLPIISPSLFFRERLTIKKSLKPLMALLTADMIVEALCHLLNVTILL